jgi:hypothetical protein
VIILCGFFNGEAHAPNENHELPRFLAVLFAGRYSFYTRECRSNLTRIKARATNTNTGPIFLEAQHLWNDENRYGFRKNTEAKSATQMSGES